MRKLSVILLLLPFQSLAQDKALTLPEAVAFAAAHSPVMDTANKTQSIRHLEYKNAFAKLLPSLDLSATGGVQNNIPVSPDYSLTTANTSAPWYSAINLGLTETLYDNGVSLTQLSIADKTQDLANVTRIKSRANLVLDVATEFYNFSLSHALVQVRGEQLKILQKQFDLLSNQYKQGLKPRLDFLRFKTQVQRAQIEKITAEKNKDLSVTRLLKLLRGEVQEDKTIQFEPVAISRQNMADILPKSSPDPEGIYDFQLAKIQREINDKNVTFSKRKYWPQVTVGAGLTYANLGFVNSGTSFATGNQLSYNALITLQYNIWDWGLRKRDVQIAEFNRDIQANDLNLNLLDVGSKVDGLMVDVSRIRESYSLNQDLLSSEEQNYQNIEIQYHEGNATYLDLITSLTSLLEAKVQFYSAYFESLQILAKYQFYEGSIYEKLSKQN